MFQRTMLRPTGLAAVLALALFGGCGADEDGGAGVTFTADAEPLKNFSFDTGMIPKSSPGQVSLKLSAGGKLHIEAAGQLSKDGVQGKAGAGKIALDLHAKIDGQLKIDSPIKKVDGDLPGLKDIDIPITGEAAFDPFVLDDGQSAKVVVAVPETDLPDIPLGSVPGTLKLKVTNKSSVTSTFEGGCMRVAGEQATYVGTAKTSGTLVLNGTLAIEMPGLSKSVELGDIEVPIPDTDTPIDFGAQPTKGVSDGQKGRSCPATPGSGTNGDDPTNGDPTKDGGTGATPSPKDGGTSTTPDFTATATIDGAPAKLTDYYTSEYARDNDLYRVTTFEGSFQGVNFTMSISAKATGQGCADGQSFLFWFEPPAGEGSPAFITNDRDDCGLSLTNWSPTRRSGSFGGALVASAGSHNVTLTFDVKAKPQ